MEEKKELTTKQKKNKYRVLQYVSRVSEFVVIPIPYAVLAIVNRDEWFAQADGWKIGLGGSLAIALMLIATLLVTKQKEEGSKLTDGYVTLILGWLSAAFVFTLLADIMNQIANIMWFGAIGLAAAFGLDLTSKTMRKKADHYKVVIEEANKQLDSEQAVEEVKQEREAKKVKIKVVKK